MSFIGNNKKSVIEINNFDSILCCIQKKIKNKTRSDLDTLSEYNFQNLKKFYIFLTSMFNKAKTDNSNKFYDLTYHLDTKILFKKESEYKIIKKIGQGSYGMTFLIKNKYDNSLSVLKIPILEEKNISEFRDKMDISDFMEEIVTHLLLLCFHGAMEKYLSLSFEQPFPEIFSIFKTSVQNRIIPTYTLEKLDINFGEYIQNSSIDLYEIVSIILQLATKLFLLQNSIKFMHRDLHISNVMLNKDDSDFSVIYDLKKPPIVIKRKYRVYIIDFGQSYAKLDNCCNISEPIFGSSYSSIYENKSSSFEDGQVNIFNESHDLRLFLHKIYSDLSDYIPKKLFVEIKKDIEPYYKNNNIYNETFFYNAISFFDKKFTPQNIIKKMLKLLYK